MLLCICLFSVGITVAIAQPAPEPALYEQTSEVNNVMVKFYADYGNLLRFYVIENSPERRARLLTTITAYIDTISKLDFNKLNTGTKAEYILLKGEAENTILTYLQQQTEEALIVLGAYRRNRVSRWFRESMADVLIKNTRFPLFIAHNK